MAKQHRRELIVSDLHAPYELEGALRFVKQVAADIKPDTIVFIGDEIDAHAFSRYAKDPDEDSPGKELAAGIEHLKPWYSAFPNALLCESNHTIRPWRKAADAGLPRSMVKTVRQVLKAPKGWRWASHHLVDGVLHVHGDGFSGKNAALDAAKSHRANVVLGHVHAYAGIQYHSGLLGTVWGMNVGCLIDDSRAVFNYAKNSPNRPTLGIGVVIDGIPRFIPYA